VIEPRDKATPRTASSVLLSEEERKAVRVAAARKDVAMSQYIREAAMARVAAEAVQ